MYIFYHQYLKCFRFYWYKALLKTELNSWKIGISGNHLTLDTDKVSFKIHENSLVLIFSAVTDSGGGRTFFDISGQRHTERIYLIFFFSVSLYFHTSTQPCPAGQLCQLILNCLEDDWKGHSCRLLRPPPSPTHHLKAARQQHLLTWPLSPSSAARRRPPRQIAAGIFYVSIPERRALARLTVTRLLLWEQRIVLSRGLVVVVGVCVCGEGAWMCCPGSSPLDSAKTGMCTPRETEVKCDLKRMYCCLKRLNHRLSCSGGFILGCCCYSSHQGWYSVPVCLTPQVKQLQKVPVLDISHICLFSLQPCRKLTTDTTQRNVLL